MYVAVPLMCLPCRGDLDHHLGTLKSDLGSIGLFILDLSSINNHLLRQSHSLLEKKIKPCCPRDAYKHQADQHLKAVIYFPVVCRMDHYSLSPVKVKTSR